jgi:putative FmdB family regulatory protein
MPLYEYECDDCGRRFEKIQKFSDPLEDKCPTCGGHVRKLASSPAIQFKGSGFYITDYAKKDHTAAAKADRDESGKPEKSEASGKGEKSEKSDRPEKSDKSDSAKKPDTSAASASSTSSKGSGESASSSSSSSSSSPVAAPTTKSST